MRNAGHQINTASGGGSVYATQRGDIYANGRPPAPRIRILLLAANPLSSGRLAIDEEARQIGERLRLADERDAYELITCLAVRPMDLLQYLNQHRPQIVHFSGHGDRAGQIVLAAGDGREQRKPSTRRSRRWPCTASPSGTSPSSWRDRTPTPL